LSAAVVWSGGKDSTLALDRAVGAGLEVRVLLNFHDAASQRIRFHGVRRELIARQADALGMLLVQRATTPSDFEQVFLDALRLLKREGITDLVFGNIHLADVRAWYEERTTAAGFAHHEPLWDSAPSAAVREFIDRGYRAIITSVDIDRAPRQWLGRMLDDELLDELEASACDVAGEAGEYHTFVWDGPRFAAPLRVSAGTVLDAGTHLLLDLLER
jgi:diphthine-ammonia ligase